MHASDEQGDRPRSYSTADVARRLGISIPTVQRWVDAGQIRAWKTVGGHRRIDGDSAELLFAERRCDAPELSPAGVAMPAALAVMVVDDNAADRELISAMVCAALPQASLSVFDSGIQALVAIGRIAPDIVVTDLLMPHLDGMEMLRQLASQCVVRPRLIVAVSSLTPDQLAHLGELPPDVHFVAKPIDPPPFIETLRSRL